DWGNIAPHGPVARRSAATGPVRVKQASGLNRVHRVGRGADLAAPPGVPSGLPARERPGIANSFQRRVAGVEGAALPATGSASLKGPCPKLLAIDAAPYLRRLRPNPRPNCALATINCNKTGRTAMKRAGMFRAWHHGLRLAD